MLLVTGGHTVLAIAERVGQYKILGMTLDDALGEAFDKVAKLINIGFPGGPQIERFAKNGSPTIKLAQPLINSDDCNFSFSGLKTSVLKIVEMKKKKSCKFKSDLCSSFQYTILNILKKKCEIGLKIFEKNYPDKKKKNCYCGWCCIKYFFKKEFRRICS